jgi:arginine-tRNA-protein transferase
MTTVKFGLSTTFDCGYLPEQKEQLLVYVDEQPLSPSIYAMLQNQGFRRSEGNVYKPHCKHCNACQSIRLPVYKFKLKNSQKRILKKANKFTVKLSNAVSDSYYPLFEKYINTKHIDGVMYPANESQLASFAKCDWMDKIFIELFDQDILIAVAICDVTPDSLSAVYTFYDPDYLSYSLGTLMILQQINITKQLDKNWLYLGYYIEDCEKMNYKTRFSPYQIRSIDGWVEVS